MLTVSGLEKVLDAAQRMNIEQQQLFGFMIETAYREKNEELNYRDIEDIVKALKKSIN